MVTIHCYLFLSDWDSTEPANSFDTSLYFSLRKTNDASDSISELVWFCVPDCESADPASFLAVAEAFGSCSTLAARLATESEVRFLFMAFLYMEGTNCRLG